MGGGRRRRRRGERVRVRMRVWWDWSRDVMRDGGNPVIDDLKF